MNSDRKSFGKKERLCSVKAISALFNSGRSFHVPPVRVVFMTTGGDDQPQARILISVPKRNFKRAVDRNLIRRRIREAYRLNSGPLRESLTAAGRSADIAFVYTDTAIQPFSIIERCIKESIDRLIHLK